MADAGISNQVVSPNSTLVGEHYDNLDHFYRNVWGEHLHHGLWVCRRDNLETARDTMVHYVANNARISRSDCVCDVGCGYGASARILTRDYGASVVGITISAEQQRYASRAALANTRFLHRDWLENHLPDSSFDAVIAIESIEHIPDRERCFYEIARVLKPGGRTAVCGWLASAHAGPAARSLFLRPIASESRMQPLGTESDYRRLFRDANLTITAFEDLSNRVRKTWPRLAAQFLFTLVKQPGISQYLVNRHRRNRVFALTVLRIWMAFTTGSMRYGSFTAAKQ